MYPEILHLSFLHTYGVLVAIAFLVALWLAGRLGRQAGLNPDFVTNLGIYCALAAIIGAKVMLLIVEPGDFFSWATVSDAWAASPPAAAGASRATDPGPSHSPTRSPTTWSACR